MSDPLQEARRLEEILDKLCQDSLEAPLSHVDEPQIYDGQITAWFREVRDIARALAQRVEDAEQENERLRRVLGAIADIPPSPHYDMCSKTARQALRQEEER